MVLPEDPQQLVVGRDRRVEDGQHDLGVTGSARTDLLVGRIGRESAGVSDRGRPHPLRLPELALRSPETTHADDDLAETCWPGRSEGVSEHGMGVGYLDRLVAAGEGILSRDELGLAASEQHVSPALPVGWDRGASPRPGHMNFDFLSTS